MSGVEAAKRLAARAAVDAFVKNGHRVGIGSGSTVVYAVERIAERVKADKLEVKIFSMLCTRMSLSLADLCAE